jgi:hypothetical protein
MCGGRNDPRAINQVNLPRESDILPNFGFTWYRCDTAYFSAFEGVDDAGLANVRVSDEAD